MYLITSKPKLIFVFLLVLFVGNVALAQKLNENCTVSILNRTVRVNPDGSWVLPNIPANFGQVKARATCVQNGVTTSGESDFFNVTANGAVNLPPIVLGNVTQVPVSLGITPGTPSLTALGQTLQLVITATYPDNSTKDVSAANTGTNYTTSNPAIVSVGPNGLLTAVANGTVVIQATNDGATGIVTAKVTVAGVDSDGDGIPDDAEVRLGLDPNNAVDAQEDFDRDNLTNLQEFQLGTDIRKADTDGDGLSDEREVNAHNTNPLLADTDGDLIPDGVEIQTSTNPLDRNSYDLKKATASSTVKPSSFSLTTSILFPVVAQQLNWKVTLIDGKTTLDLTDDARTSYVSSDLTVCNFGTKKGEIFAGNAGNCVVTITNNTLNATASGNVKSFTPSALSFVAIPGYANNVDVSGNHAYVAAGATGLQVVDVSDRKLPRIIGSLDTPGNANDVRVVGNRVYIADGSAGLQIIDVTNPTSPSLLGAVDTPGEAQDVMVVGTLAYVADGAAGLQIINVSNPTAPAIVGSVDTTGTAKGVDVSGSIAAVADGPNAVRIIDVADPAHPQIVGNVAINGDVKDLVVRGNQAYVAAFTGGFQVVDFSTPSNPRVVGSIPGSGSGFVPRDVELSGNFAFAAEQLFPNAVPIVDITNAANPLFRTTINFAPLGDYAGTGIALDSQFVYMTGEFFIVGPENGTTGDTRLFIGQYREVQDNLGVPPTVQITSPAAGTQVIQGAPVTVTVSAEDDIAVASVSLLVNGQLVSTTSAAPYQFTFNAPATGSTLTLGATATDFGNNVGQAQNVALNLIPDPGTTVIGRVIDRDGNGVAGATVTAPGDKSATSNNNGAFSIAGVPTIQGNIFVRATLVVDGKKLFGRSSAIAPVPGGVTNVGDVTLKSGALFGSSPGGRDAGPKPGSLFSIDTQTGVATLIGTPANVPDGLSDLSFDPGTGTLYVMHGSAQRGAELLTVDPGNAQVLTRVTVSDPIRILTGSDGLAHDFSGNLFAGGWAEGRLLRLNPQTGVVLSDINVTGSGGNNHLADLAVDPTTGKLWATRGSSTGGERRLLTIDPNTGAATFLLSPKTTRVITAIAFDSDGVLYAALDGDQLATVNKTTGDIVLIGTGFGFKIAGLGFQQ